MWNAAEGRTRNGRAGAHPAAHARTGHAGREGLPRHPHQLRADRGAGSRRPAEGSQLEAIRRGARLIVATPGRLEDFLKRKLVRLDGVKILVLDEVDRMLDMGFQPAIARIAGMLPAERQTLCYSATLEGAVKEVARKYLNNPARIEIGSVLKPAENVELRTFEVEPDKKQELLEHLLDAEQGSFLVFVRTKHGADRVARRLVRNGHSATQIHGDRTQAQRNQALRSFSEGHHRVLVATDVAARGIDVANVAHVINFDMPKVAEDFVHRVGRTGRASASGVASTFAAPANAATCARSNGPLHPDEALPRTFRRNVSSVKAAISFSAVGLKRLARWSELFTFGAVAQK